MCHRKRALRENSVSALIMLPLVKTIINFVYFRTEHCVSLYPLCNLSTLISFVGDNCEIGLDKCDHNRGACKHGATCIPSATHYTCQCAPGYSGMSKVLYTVRLLK